MTNYPTGSLSQEDQDLEILTELVKRVKDSVESVLVGKTEAINLVLAALFCKGHVLVEDVPGVGKTTLVKSIAMALGCAFSRIQFTPDLVPADVLGVNFYNSAKSQFEFRQGPIFSQIVLADEINRATPRTQSALLEAMQETQISIDGVTSALPKPFFVAATENPIEMEGTFPLPEAQLDRFLIRVSMGYPEPREEADMLDRFKANSDFASIDPVAKPEEILLAQNIIGRVKVDTVVRDYIVKIVRNLRNSPHLTLGPSPRASLALQRASQALASMDGRGYVMPDDVKHLVLPVLAHRIILDPAAQLRGQSTSDVIGMVMNEIDVPIEKGE